MSSNTNSIIQIKQFLFYEANIYNPLGDTGKILTLVINGWWNRNLYLVLQSRKSRKVDTNSDKELGNKTKSEKCIEASMQSIVPN